MSWGDVGEGGGRDEKRRGGVWVEGLAEELFLLEGDGGGGVSIDEVEEGFSGVA